MTRNLKALGLALVAALALTAVASSAASAQVKDTLRANSPTGSAFLTTDNDTPHIFTYGLGSVSCEVTEFEGTIPNESNNDVTITPFYDDCEFLEEPAVVEPNGCDYVFTTTTVNGHSQVYVDCTGGGPIKVRVPSLGNCTLTVGTQETKKGVSYHTEESGGIEDLTVTITAEVTVTRDNPGNNFLCGLLAETGTGTYTGSSTLTAFEDNNGVKGARVDLWDVEHS